MSGADRPDVDWAQLRRTARRETAHAYVPYSGFPVGAAGVLHTGEVLAAPNVENASYPVGICAETALVGVVASAGHGRGSLRAVAVTDPDGAYLSPCGRCRQLLHEMGGPGLLLNERPMSEWLPGAFTPEDLR